MTINLFFFLLVILNIAVLSVAMYFVWTRLSAKGAKPLFLFLFNMLGFTAMYMCSLLVRRESSKYSMMIVAYFFILVLPIFWTQMVYELTDRKVKESWHFNLPFGILNLSAFLLFIIDIPGMKQVMYFHSCNINAPLYNCKVIYSPVFYIIMGMVLFEFLGGIGFLLYSFFAQQTNEERSRYLFLVVAVGFGILSIWLPIVIPSQQLNRFDPLPIMLMITTVLLLVATFSRRLLEIRFGPDSGLTLVDDMLLVIDADHFIQDVNMSTLNVFGVDVQDVISTQLEQAFQNYPDLLRLFTEGSAAAEPIQLMVDNEEHIFEPRITVVLDPVTSLPSGQSLLLHDVTGRSLSETYMGKVSVRRDPLTNQYTRDSFYQFGGKLLVNTRLRKQPTTVVIIDIDDLNMINERFSHLVGDQGLIQLVEIIHNMIRSTDLLARFQADELVLMLPNADEFEAYQICSRIMKKVADNRFSFRGQDFQMTVSMGYTISESSDEHDLQAVVQAAYQALDQSHSLGRSRLTFLPVDIEEI